MPRGCGIHQVHFVHFLFLTSVQNEVEAGRNSIQVYAPHNAGAARAATSLEDRGWGLRSNDQQVPPFRTTETRFPLIFKICTR